MKLLIGLLFTVLGCLAVAAGWLKIPIPSPAATGLNSTYDYDALRLTDARRLVNADLVTKPGSVLNRNGLKSVGDNSTVISNGVGYYHSFRKWKQVVGVGTSGSYGQVKIGNPFSSNLQGYAFKSFYPYNGTIQMLKNEDAVIIADGFSGPFLYQSERSFGYGTVNLYRGYKNDSVGYGPLLTPLSFNAPYEPVVGLINASGIHSGVFEYRYAATTGAAAHGPASVPVVARNQGIYLTAFDPPVFGNTKYYIDRRRNGGKWIRIDSFPFAASDTTLFIDTVTDDKATLAPDTTVLEGLGAMSAYTNFSDTLYYDSNSLVNPVDTYWIAYSFYDPVSQRESPLSAYHKITSARVHVAGGYFPKAYYVPIDLINTAYRPEWLRFYRSAANDSTVLWGMVQVMGAPLFFPGVGNDLELKSLSIPTDSGYYTKDQLLIGEGGTVVTRPPVYDKPVQFSQVLVSKTRAWGIGDPLYPERLYYSADNEVWNWSAVNYLSMDEDDNDELVYIAKSEAIDGLYAFKHNSVYAVTGYDPQYDLTTQRISNRHGAVNSRSVSAVAPFVYWLNSDLNVNRIAGGTIDTVSTTVWKTIKAMFVDYQEAIRHARLFKFNDRLLLTNDSTGITLAYFYVPGLWESIEGDTANRPLFAFDYDTLQTAQGFGSLADWLYFSNVVKFSVENTACRGIDSLNGTNTYYPLIYQTPYLSAEGQNVTATEATVNISGGSHVKASIWNEQDDSLVGSIVPIQGTAQRIGFSVNTAKYVSLLIRIDSMTSRVTIGDVSLSGRAVGNAANR